MRILFILLGCLLFPLGAGASPLWVKCPEGSPGQKYSAEKSRLFKEVFFAAADQETRDVKQKKYYRDTAYDADRNPHWNDSVIWTKAELQDLKQKLAKKEIGTVAFQRKVEEKQRQAAPLLQIGKMVDEGLICGSTFPRHQDLIKVLEQEFCQHEQPLDDTAFIGAVHTAYKGTAPITPCSTIKAGILAEIRKERTKLTAAALKQSQQPARAVSAVEAAEEYNRGGFEPGN